MSMGMCAFVWAYVGWNGTLGGRIELAAIVYNSSPLSMLAGIEAHTNDDDDENEDDDGYILCIRECL